MKGLVPILAVGCLSACSQFNTPKDVNGLTLGGEQMETAQHHYQEHHRPQFHFTPRSGWMNDPNGMVYIDGEYHLFYQHYPDDNVWGPMHWGHAISKDLVHWEHKPIALYPDQHGWIFSGSAVFDKNNTSGLGTADNPPLIAIFTYHNDKKARAGSKNFQTQGIAYSLDKGRSWTPYEGNPVLIGPDIPDFRDPKVSWYEPEQKWVMALAVDDHISFYSSKNLINWQFESDFGIDAGTHAGVWECPDLIKMPIEGTDQEKYVLLVSINPGGPNGGSATQYFVGDFNGSEFILDETIKQQVSQIPAQFPQGNVFADFETDFSDWTVKGDAFSLGPVAGNAAGQTGVSNFVGKRLVNSFNKGDATTGEITSQTFTIEQPHINFYIGGGQHPGKTGINLIVDGEVVRSETGHNSEKLDIASWDVSEFIGKSARLKIVDHVTSGWGHINVDQIVFASEPAYPIREPAIWLDYGTDNYAGVTWANVPESDGRYLFIGWMSNWLYANDVPTDEWRSAMTIPRTLALKNTSAGYRVVSQPVKELEVLRVASNTRKLDVIDSKVNLNQLSGIEAEQFELELSLDAKQTQSFTLEIGNQINEKISLIFDRENNQIVLDRSNSGKARFYDGFAGKQFAPLPEGQKYQIRVYQDTSSTELFVNQGEVVMTALVFPNKDFTQVNLSTQSEIELSRWSMHKLNSIWNSK
ncbi:glycoside hydrolase family 32 protein [Catenovulum sp. 2E275]|uniref:glycoside hydrolase family 32 protein n=1 Tax=Catenovulum sp. 2E275 TaxID=2980497 RepID=UPI00292A5393|nr:glycoside hydrolase family 32 protein [Catenovulum sp. 2E275]